VYSMNATNLRIFCRFCTARRSVYRPRYCRMHYPLRTLLALALIVIGLDMQRLAAQPAQMPHSTDSLARGNQSLALERRFAWLVSNALLFRPLRAHVLEPRVGAVFQTENFAEQSRTLRLDIGTSVDVVEFPFDLAANPVELRVGADFFTYTRLRSEANFRFPVETSDYFFGVNSSFAWQYSHELHALARLRVAHISSHLVDGTPNFTQTFVYSREFIDLVAAVQWKSLRFYAGGAVLFHTIPDRFGVFTPQIGMDVDTPFAQFGAMELRFCAGYDAKLPIVDKRPVFTQSAQAGVRVGAQGKPGLLLGLYWFQGQSMHGMFFQCRDSYIGAGFQIDL